MNICLDNICFNYKKKKIFDDLSLNIELESDCLVLMGHNGAGKTTLINLICGILKPISGKIILNDKQNIAYLPFENNIYPNLTVLGNIKFWYQIYNNKQMNLDDAYYNYLVDALKMRDLLDTKSIFLSSGEEKKLAFIIVLLSNSKFIILDEPFNGIDPISTLEIIDLINNLRNKGTNFLISSHQLDILEKVATKYIIMKNHNITETGSMHSLNKTSLYKMYENVYED